MFDEVFFYVLIALCQGVPVSDEAKIIDEVYGGGQYYYTKTEAECHFAQEESMIQALSIEMMPGEAKVSAGASFSQNYGVQVGGVTKEDQKSQTIAIDGMVINIHQDETELALFGGEADTPLAYMAK